MRKKTVAAYMLLAVSYLMVFIGYLNNWRHNEDWIVFATIPVILISLFFFISGAKK